MRDLRKDFQFNGNVLINFVNLTDREKEMVRVWRNDESIRRWMYTRHVIDKKEHSDFIERLRSEDRNFYWLLKDRQSEYIGVIDLKKENKADRQAYLGIYKRPDCKMLGAGDVLMKNLKMLAFDIADLQVLKLEVSDDNERAIKFYKRMGFQEEGRRNEFIVMSMTKEREANL